MSQQRTRKSAAAEQGTRGRSTAKAAGDQCPPMKNTEKTQQCGDNTGSVPLCNIYHKERSRSRSKVPKNLRNDLENALVALCDVWFEEIKPHLVSNNIKVHVNGEGGAGAAAGDHQRPPAGAAGPACSHLDPGAARDPRQQTYASSASCWSMQPIVSRAQCRRPPASSQQPSSPVRHHPSQNQSPCRGPKLESPWMRRAPAELEPARSPQWRVPRLCHFYTNPPNVTSTVPKRPLTEPVSHQPKHFGSQYLHLHGHELASSLSRANRHHHSTTTTVLSKHKKSHNKQHNSKVPYEGASFKTFQEAVLSAPTTAPFLQNVQNTMRTQQKRRQSVPYHSSALKHRQEDDQRQNGKTPHFYKPAADTVSKLQIRPSLKYSNQDQQESHLQKLDHRLECVPCRDTTGTKKHRRPSQKSSYQPHHKPQKQAPKHRKQVQRLPCAASVPYTASHTIVDLERRPSQKSPNPYEQFNQDLRYQKQHRMPSPDGYVRRCPAASTFFSRRSKTQLQIPKQQNINKDPERVQQKLSTKTISLPRPSLCRTQSRWQLYQNKKIFQDDLINIIAEGNNKHLQILYESPHREETPSIMNLLHTAHAHGQRVKKIPPWR